MGPWLFHHCTSLNVLLLFHIPLCCASFSQLNHQMKDTNIILVLGHRTGNAIIQCSHMLNVNLMDLFEVNQITMGAPVMLLTNVGSALGRIPDAGL